MFVEARAGRAAREEPQERRGTGARHCEQGSDVLHCQDLYPALSIRSALGWASVGHGSGSCPTVAHGLCLKGRLVGDGGREGGRPARSGVIPPAPRSRLAWVWLCPSARWWLLPSSPFLLCIPFPSSRQAWGSLVSSPQLPPRSVSLPHLLCKSLFINPTSDYLTRVCHLGFPPPEPDYFIRLV